METKTKLNTGIPFCETTDGMIDRIENLESGHRILQNNLKEVSLKKQDMPDIDDLRTELKALRKQAKDIQRAILQGKPLPRFREITIHVDTHCPDCGSENVVIEDADEGEYSCRCYECDRKYSQHTF